jgi:hypothetical protein
MAVLRQHTGFTLRGLCSYLCADISPHRLKPSTLPKNRTLKKRSIPGYQQNSGPTLNCTTPNQSIAAGHGIHPMGAPPLPQEFIPGLHRIIRGQAQSLQMDPESISPPSTNQYEFKCCLFVSWLMK